MELLDLPLESLVNITCKLDYRSITELRLVSSALLGLTKNPLIMKIEKSKRPDKIARILRHHHHPSGPTCLSFIHHQGHGQGFSIYTSETAIKLLSSYTAEAEEIIDLMKRNETFCKREFGSGYLSVSKIPGKMDWTMPDMSGATAVLVILSSIILQRLLEEFVQMVDNNEYGSLVIFEDRSILKRRE